MSKLGQVYRTRKQSRYKNVQHDHLEPISTNSICRLGEGWHRGCFWKRGWYHRPLYYFKNHFLPSINQFTIRVFLEHMYWNIPDRRQWVGLSFEQIFCYAFYLFQLSFFSKILLVRRLPMLPNDGGRRQLPWSFWFLGRNHPQPMEILEHGKFDDLWPLRVLVKRLLQLQKQLRICVE